MSIRIGVVGVGNIGYHHVRIYNELDYVDYVGIFDVDQKRASKVAEEFNTHTFETYSDLLDSVDALSICASTNFHYSLAKEAIVNGKHLLVEKPITTSYLETKELLSLAETNKVLLHVGHVERFNPVFAELKRVIKDGELGEIIHIIAKRVGGFPPKITSTGVYYDLAVHDVDLIMYMMNDAPESMSVKKINTFSSIVEDSCAVSMSYPNSSAYIQANWITPVKIRNYSVTGTRGHAEVNLINQTIEIFEHNALKEDFEEREFSEFLQKYGELKKRNIVVKRSEPLKNELIHFIKVIHKEEISLMSPDEILRLMFWMDHYED